jgi:hypothetical protein
MDRDELASSRVSGFGRIAKGIAAAFLVLALPGHVAAEPFADLYTGKSFTQDADIRIKQSRLGNEYTFSDVSFDDRSFEAPPYYGIRVGYFFETYPWLGGGLEFFHFKVYADVDEARPLQGLRAGSAVNTTAPVNSVIQQFNVSHGVNFLTLDALFRYRFLPNPEQFPNGRIQLYGGVGLGPVITHPETKIDNVRSEPGYEVAGLGVQSFAGVRVLLFKYVGLFAEYKFTHARLDLSVASGSGRVDLNTHHVVGGISIHLPSF